MWNPFQKFRNMRKQIMGINQRNVELIYPHNQYKDYALADDKVVTKSVLEQYNIACAQTYAVIERIGDIESGWASVQQYKKIAIKPANGRGGGGIKILKKSSDGTAWISGGKSVPESQIYKHFADIIMGVFSLGGGDRVLIEYCIEPHPFFHEIYPAGVPDFRVILLKQVPILAMLRVPTDRSDGKANLHQGGLGIGIDMERGLLKTAYDGTRYHAIHPDVHTQINGRIIPQWKETLDLAIATSKAFPLEYLGVDIVLDKHIGPLIMEINVRPGLGIQLVNQVGMPEVIQKYPEFRDILS